MHKAYLIKVDRWIVCRYACKHIFSYHIYLKFEI